MACCLPSRAAPRSKARVRRGREAGAHGGARSYGPGRYERSYEDWGVDYPAGFVRWTEGRNLETILDLIAASRLSVADLVTHRFPIAEASAAYELVDKRSEPFLAIQLTYPATPAPEEPVRLTTPRPSAAEPGVGLVGAGVFASTVLVPNLKAGGFQRFVSVASASGLSATQLGARRVRESRVRRRRGDRRSRGRCRGGGHASWHARAPRRPCPEGGQARLLREAIASRGVV